MRSVLSRGKVFSFLVLFTCFACSSGGGDPGVTTIAQVKATISIPNPGETATVLIDIRSDGTLLWAGAVPPDVVAVVTGLTLNLASDSSVVADLLGTVTFDPTTGTASGSVMVTAAEAAAIAANPLDYLVTLLTSTKPPATGELGLFTTIEWHAVLLGTNESTVEDADARGAATFRVTSPTTIDFVIGMKEPVQADVTMAHIHVGPQGTNGLVVIDLNPPGATRDVAAGTLSGQITVEEEQVARIAAEATGFYCNVHTAAAPNGVARGQLEEGTINFMAALLGSAEVPTVVDGNARGGATFEFDTLTSGRVMTSLHAPAEDIEDVILQHIHIGAAGTPGAILVDLMGADYVASLVSRSAEATFAITQKTLTRILADPTGFYCNLHTTAAPNGLVRGQLSQDPRTINAAMTGAQETTPVAGTSGTMRVIFTGPHACSYTITMVAPPAADLVNAHVHDGPAGQDGAALIDLFLSGDRQINGNTITGTAVVSGRTVSRILAGTPGGSALASADLPSIFYANVHTVANPLGAARGQFTQASIAEPPSGLSYATPVTYLTGAPIAPNTPTSTGGAITTYVISPTLSTGLSINATTGIISGTPTATRAATNYTVTASNASGSTPATVNITVNVGPPTLLLYQTPVTYVKNQAITPNSPVTSGGAISTYIVNPALPTGLSISGTTGVITGTPTVAQAQAGYTVTGSNTAGQVQRTVQITVTDTLQAPSNLSYGTQNPSYPTGYAISDNVPTVTGSVTMWAVNPALPAGLTLGTDGKITGTPTTVTAAANYVVTASNAAGSTPSTLNIGITLGKPAPFGYSPSSTIIGYIGTQITTISPQVSGSDAGGTVTSYSISGTLLAGLSFSTSTGVISGTPTAKTPDNNADGIPDLIQHTVTATNSTGSEQTTVSVIGY